MSRQTIRSPYAWLTAIIAVMITAVLVTGASMLQYLERQFVERTGKDVALAAVDIAGKLDLLMAERYGDIQMIARSKTLQGHDPAGMTQYLQRMMTAYPVYEWMAATDETGRIVAATDAVSLGKDYSSHLWFQAARDHVFVAASGTASFSDDSDRVAAVIFSAPIRGTRDEFFGVVTSRISLSVLEDAFVRTVTALQAQWGTDVQIEYQFVNREGDVLADSHLREEGRVNLKRMGLPSARLYDSALPGFVEEKHLRRQVDVLTGYAMTKGVEDLDKLRWGVLVRVDRHAVLASISAVLWKIGTVGTALVAPMVAFLFWSTSRLKKEYLHAESESGRARSAESAWRDSEARILQIIDETPDALIIADGIGRITLINRRAVDLFGYTNEEFQGQTLDILLPEHKRNGHAHNREQNATDSHIRAIEAGSQLLARKKDGTVFSVEISMGLLQTSEGVFAIRVIRDITERLQAEEERRKLTERWLLLLESSGEGIFGIDPQGRCTFMNRAAAQMLGYRPEELVGRKLHELTHHHRADGTPYSPEECRLSEVFRSGSSCHVNDEVLWRKDGLAIPVEYSSFPVIEQGIITGAVVNFTDITSRKQAEAKINMHTREVAENNRALDTALAQAQAATQAKSAFLATMSHEIRTPMNGIIGMAGLLLDTELTREQREYAGTIRRCGESLLTLVNEILDFSKIEAGKVDLDVIDFDLRSLVEDVLALLAEKAHRKGLELGALIHATVPTALRGDPGRVRQVITNLVGNAVKFTERGEVTVTVELDESTPLWPDGTVQLRIEVRDTGIGMTPAQCTKLFQPFSQADTSTTRKYGGTGLGLAICKQLVEIMQGAIGVESALGRGSRFWFTARLACQTDPATKTVDSWAILRDRRVLIVDDNATNRAILEQQLLSQGMLSEPVADGQCGLERLRTAAAAGTPFDLAIMDTQMPGMDGWTLARLIKDDPAITSVRLIMLTSIAQRGDALAAQATGFDAYLTKPIRQAHLYDCLSLVLSGRTSAAIAAGGAAIPLITRHTVSEARAHMRDRVLVVEDNFVNQKVAVRMLEYMGYRVDVAATGRAAVEAVARIPFAAVFMDCQMAVMDGFEATRLIRKREARAGARNEDTGPSRESLPSAPPRVPVIAMTANAMKGDRERCLEAGMDDYIAKPVRREDLAAVLARWIPGQPSVPETSAAGLSAALNNKGCVDREVLADLRSLDPTGELFATLSAQFLVEAPQRVASMREALTQGDAARLANTAHDLKGSSGNLGAIRMLNLCDDLEVVCRANDLTSVKSLLDQLESDFALVRVALLQEQNRLMPIRSPNPA